MELLLSNGARISQGNYCALLNAAAANRPDIFGKLLASVAIDHELLIIFGGAFALCSSTDTIKFLIDTMSRWCIQFPSDISGPLLSKSIAYPEKMEYLLSIGADPRGKYEQEKIGETWLGSCPSLLSEAIRNRAFGIVDILLRHGADIDAGDDVHGTPLFISMKIGNFQLASKLLEYGANPNKDVWMYRSCWKLLHLAAANNDISFLELYLENGVGLEARCDLCPSPIWPAIMNENSQMIHFLLDKGADINDCDMYGRTLLYRAEQHHLDDACKILSNLGARRETSEQARQECIENTVRRLSGQLMPQSGAEGVENSETSPEWLSYYRWLFLGRSLFLGNDCGQAIIALEQTFKRYETQKGVISLPASGCAMCDLDMDGKYHLCKDSEEMGICHYQCLQKHEAQLKEDGILDTHEYLTYPREFLLEVPENHVALTENEFIPLRTWLEGLASWEVHQTRMPHGEGHREPGSLQ
jgi:hypothetical protein